MINLACPHCGRALPAADMNVQTDVAVCRGCDVALELSALVQRPTASEGELTRPPPGAWFEQRRDGFRVGATTRSAIAFFIVPFMAVWSGGSLGGIYGSQLTQHHFSLKLSLFGIPFLLGTVILGSVALMAIAGKHELTVLRDEAELFTGVGPIGRRRRFRWSDVRRIDESTSSTRRGISTQIVLHGVERRTFGDTLSEARRDFVMRALRARLHASPRPPGTLRDPIAG